MDLEVKVPATVANLGPGFDCLGAAVGIWLRVRLARSDATEIAGDGTPLPRNLIHRGWLAAHEEAGVEAPPVKIEVAEAYPSARGMGASASAIVAGLVGARHFSELAVTDADLARLAIAIEGHSDNVLSALFGGLVLSSGEGWMRFTPVETIAPVILVAREKSKTEESRLILPAEVPRADAVANVAATAGLLGVLTGAQPPDALLVATEDRLHEPYRLPHLQETLDLHVALRSKGVAAALAGAGPSIVCLVEGDRVTETAGLAKEIVPPGWQVLTPAWDLVGAQVR
ncbi:MAG: homoserine kinase [Actinomycetota bacterium]